MAAAAELEAGAGLPKGKVSAEASVSEVGTAERELARTGYVRLSVNIGRTNQAIQKICRRIDGRVWILVDEWSSVPEKLQPYLADFFRRTLFTIQNVSVQIAAIEHRASFRIGAGAETIGIELGSDAFADVNLDDVFVYENNPDSAVQFFREMLFRHLTVSSRPGELVPADAAMLVREAFTQEPAFAELVRSCEGVPRDFINIIQITATRAKEDKISMPIIRSSAKDWYERDKAAFLDSDEECRELLHWIIDIVIGDRRARAFLVPVTERHERLERLFDERLLHIARRSYSAKDSPGVRYRVWKVDYGCYVDLMQTNRAPTGFLVEGFEAEHRPDIPVPEDDYRAVRRAILELSEFDRGERRRQ